MKTYTLNTRSLNVFIALLLLICLRPQNDYAQTTATVAITTSRTLPQYFCGDNGTNTIQDNQGYNCFNNVSQTYDQLLMI
ncbi:MAG: hypothetical protein JNK61_08185 [Bacteroidia bacterium]|nr:hypothetical protein [Bacteroidia bacterium]HQV00979.1 hypothetical protein [Bacteroidia bacterium]